MQQIIAAHPDVIFTQLDPQTAAVMFQNFKELDNLAIPIVGTDVTSGNDYLKAITYPIAHAHLVSVYGTNATGAAADNFAAAFAAQNGRQRAADRRRQLRVRRGDQPRAGHGQGGHHRRSGGHRRMKQVTNPPGTPCDTYSACLAGIKAGTKIKMDGASGDLIFNASTMSSVRTEPSRPTPRTGAEIQVALLSATDLAAATP